MAESAKCIAFDNYNGRACLKPVVGVGRLLCYNHSQNPLWVYLENALLKINSKERSKQVLYSECKKSATYLGLNLDEFHRLIDDQKHALNQQKRVKKGLTDNNASGHRGGPPPLPYRPPLPRMVEKAPEFLKAQGSHVAQASQEIEDNIEEALRALGDIVQESGGPQADQFLGNTTGPVKSPHSEETIVQQVEEEIRSENEEKSDLLNKINQVKLKPVKPREPVEKGSEVANILLRALQQRRAAIGEHQATMDTGEEEE